MYYFYQRNDTEDIYLSEEMETANLGDMNLNSIFKGLDSQKVKKETELSGGLKVDELIKEIPKNPAEKEKLLKAVVTKAKITPLIPEGYDWMERKHSYPGITSIRSFHPNKEVSIETLVSENPLDAEDREIAAQYLIRTSLEELEPLEDVDLKNKNLENIDIYYLDDESSPIYLVQAKVKGTQKEVYFAVTGKAGDIASELEKIKNTFSKVKTSN